MDKINYGLKNVKVAPVKYDSATKKYTFGTMIDWPGAESMTLPKNGSVNKFYADDSTWYSVETNQGYTGCSLNVYTMPEEIKTKIYKEIKVAGTLTENSAAVTAECAVFAQFAGDESDKRIVLFRCKFDRADEGSESKQENINPKTFAVPFEVMPRENDGFVKSSARLADAPDIYNNWFTSPFEPPVPSLVTFSKALGADGKPFVFDPAVTENILTASEASDTIKVTCDNGNLTAVVKKGDQTITDGKITYTSGANDITVEVKSGEGDNAPTAVYNFKVTYSNKTT